MPAVSHRARHNARSSCPTPARAVEERVMLRATIRQCKAAVSGSLLSLSVPQCYRPDGKPFTSPIKAWQNAIKCPINRQRARAERQLKAIEEIYPTPPWFKVRPATAADKRIAKQYDPKATPINWRFFRARDAAWYLEKHQERMEERHQRALAREPDFDKRMQMIDQFYADRGIAA